ncbi:hypothetical protein GCM10022254_44960 [Actinomadura meridiana]|uniref:MFS transporter n=1 Tax=Actinomadura meridiana TaxID=559626 RepID=A0ABP8C9S8_9ACTN
MTRATPEEGASGGGVDEADASWRRDFRLLLGGSAFSQLGTLGAAAANPLLALVLTDSPIVAGWVAAASTLPGLLLHMPVGLLVDHYDRRRIMLVSQLVRVLNSVLLFIGLCTIAEPWPFLLLAAAIDGSCAVFFRIAEFAAVRFVVPDGETENAMGKSEARHHVALVLGRPLGGLLFAVAHALPYALDALTSFVSVISLLLMKRKRLQSFESRKLRVRRISRNAILPSFGGVVSRMREDGILRIYIILCAVANIGFQIVILLLVVEAQRQNFSGTVIGAMLATSGASGFLGAITAARVVGKLRPERTLQVCMTLWVPLLLIVASSAGKPLLGMCAWGICSLMGAYINVALAVHQSRVIPPDFLGRVEGVTRFLTTGAVALGATLGGYAITVVGTRWAAWAVFGGFVVIAVFAWLSVIVQISRRVREVGWEICGTVFGAFAACGDWVSKIAGQVRALKGSGDVRALDGGDHEGSRGPLVGAREDG